MQTEPAEPKPPESYSSANEYLKTAIPVAVRQNSEKATFSDPIREFERIGFEVTKHGTYYQWNTLSKEQRISHLDTLRTPHFPPSASEDEKAMAIQRRWKYLNYIIQEESRLMRDGFYEVAVKAFNLLIPKQR